MVLRYWTERSFFAIIHPIEIIIKSNHEFELNQTNFESMTFSQPSRFTIQIHFIFIFEKRSWKEAVKQSMVFSFKYIFTKEYKDVLIHLNIITLISKYSPFQKPFMSNELAWSPTWSRTSCVCFAFCFSPVSAPVLSLACCLIVFTCSLFSSSTYNMLYQCIVAIGGFRQEELFHSS